MKLSDSKFSIANLRDMLTRGDLVANKAYQRAQGLWPNASRSYFIDTILEGYPFPKMYFHEFLDRKSKKVRTEIVDGQQRITTIFDFLNDKFTLGKNSQRFAGKKFSDLTEEIQDEFLLYTVAADVIRDAGTAQILQMFRRMNSYTLPLNSAEKRHSEFFGEFKDMVTRVLDNKSVLTDWNILTTRQIVRMADATFVADLVLAMEEGIVSTSDKKLHDLYNKYDVAFPAAIQYEGILNEIFDFITLDLSVVQSSFMIKPYAMHALCCALYHNKYGLPNAENQLGLDPIDGFISGSAQQACENLLELAAAHEGNDLSRFPLYVEAMREGSNRERQRSVRIATLCRALRGKL